MYVGLISDTHGTFADDVRSFLDPVDVIWHAGDFGGIACADAIAAFKPLIGVYGNCDGGDVRVAYPLTQVFMAEEVKVAMTHIGGFPGRYDWEAYNLITHNKPRIFVCGHSHILRVMGDKKFDMMVFMRLPGNPYRPHSAAIPYRRGGHPRHGGRGVAPQRSLLITSWNCFSQERLPQERGNWTDRNRATA